jgi:uncharacterized protein YceK
MRGALLCVALALGLSGCQSVLKNLETCERHYDGNVSGGTISPAVIAGKAIIDCCPVGTVANEGHTNCVQPPLA